MESFALAPHDETWVKTIEARWRQRMATRDRGALRRRHRMMHATRCGMRQEALLTYANANKVHRKRALSPYAHQGQEKRPRLGPALGAETGIGRRPEHMGKMFRKLSQASLEAREQVGARPPPGSAS